MADKAILVSSLEKIFPDTAPVPMSGKLTVLLKDRLSFQAGLFLGPYERTCTVSVKMTVDSPLKPWLSVRRADLVPAKLPVIDPRDGDFLRTSPGLYPDLLTPVGEDEPFELMTNTWQGLWFTLETGEDTPAGAYPVFVTLEYDSWVTGKQTVSLETRVEVIPAALPEQELLHTEWFHCDCVADYYGLEPFSEAHWAAVRAQIEMAAHYGVNMILTPTFTPALDTAVGTERTTVQLVDVAVNKGEYTFGFEKFDRWVKMCQGCGIQYFEMAHLYTQWGAEHCPKVMATVDGVYKKIFGWEDDAVGERYRDFLEHYLPALTAHVEAMGLKDRIVFHISDEPSRDHLEQYKKCREQVDHLLEGYTIMDALSNYDFYKTGSCACPVVASDHAEPFLEAKVPGLWIYYCISQGYEVSNRFLAMPSQRNRILGTQLYKFKIRGFLHWGYNFYNSALSLEHLDPFAYTDGNGHFPAGDPFLVYPGKDFKPLASIRLLVFSEALNDLRAFKLLESLAGRDFVMNLLEGGLSEEITLKRYPRDAAYLLTLRQQVNEEIGRRMAR